MKLMMPFTPHLANECLEKNCEKPIFSMARDKKKCFKNINLLIQVNGKKRYNNKLKKI